MALTTDKLNAIVKEQEKKGNHSEYPNVTFLPEGTHKGRFFVDPKDEIFLEYYTYGYFANGIRDPAGLDESELPDGFVHKLEEVAEELAELGYYKYRSKYNFICYFYLIETDARSDDWKPGNLYVIICNRTFSKSFINFITSLTKDAPEALIDTLSPDKTGALLTISFTGGRDGTCSIGAAFPTKQVEPTDMTDLPWIPLEDAHIRPGFNQAKYNRLLEKYNGILKEVKDSADKKAAENSTADQPNTQESDQVKQEDKKPDESKAEDKPAESEQVSQPKEEAKSEQSAKPAASEDKPEASSDGAKANTDDPWAKFQPKE